MRTANLQRLVRSIRIRDRLPLWGIRIILGTVLLSFSEVVMWQNPPAHSPVEWAVHALLYICLAAVLIDAVVRFQARDIAGLALVSGLYGLLSATFVGHDVFTNLPWNLLLRGMGLQTGAGLYGLLFFVVVMQGRQVDPRAIAFAVGIGLIWGIWIRWYPVQQVTNWGEVSIESATVYFVVAFVITGALFLLIGPRFRAIREQSLQLQWWEWIVVGAPLYVAISSVLVDGTTFPLVPLLIVLVLIAIVIGALYLQKHGNEPSILANLTFSAPNAVTYVILSVAFLVAGTVGAALTSSVDSPLGVAAYFLVIGIGLLWLPAASALVGLRAYRRED